MKIRYSMLESMNEGWRNGDPMEIEYENYIRDWIVHTHFF